MARLVARLKEMPPTERTEVLQSVYVKQESAAARGIALRLRLRLLQEQEEQRREEERRRMDAELAHAETSAEPDPEPIPKPANAPVASDALLDQAEAQSDAEAPATPAQASTVIELGPPETAPEIAPSPEILKALEALSNQPLLLPAPRAD